MYNEVDETSVLQARKGGKFSFVFQRPRTVATTDELLPVRREVRSLFMNELLQFEYGQILHKKEVDTLRHKVFEFMIKHNYKR